ncbi:MAG TPA: hypothetical protein VMF08_06555 [Candidatus Sulfotelmatobacter sp.]|nr:hypothetical protein [Candidatus Sulfotelmatobacter sp.]
MKADSLILRRFNAVAWPILLALSFLSISSALAGEVTLQNDFWIVAFDSDSGALTRLESKSPQWTIEGRPNLGASFWLKAESADHQENVVLGQKQKPVAVEQISPHQILLQWQNLVSERGDTLPITLTATVSLTNDMLTFDASVKNESSLMVSAVEFPCLGDLSPPTPNAPLWGHHTFYGDLKHDDISRGSTIMSKQSLFCLIQSTNAGIYVEMKDPTQPYLLNFVFEHHGFDDSSANPSRLEFQTTHYIYAHPHTSVQLAPVVMRCYAGDFHAGLDCYKEWRSTWFKEPHLPDWAREVHSWTMIRMTTPEQDYGLPYTNFVQYGREWADNGVRAVQVVGWNIGGQDADDPSQDTDPGLGTWQQWHDAIAQVQAMGVKVILFAKLNWADLTTSWYSNELYKYQCTDPNGKRYEQGGYAYVTPTQLAGIGLHRRAVMDFLDPDYQAVANEEFQKILALGSEGWLWDEICHHADVLYTWAPGHGYTPPGYIYRGDMPLSAQLRAAADKVSPDFIFAGEGPEDWLMQYYPVSETGITSVPFNQYLDTTNSLVLAGVSGFDDREALNLILMDRYVIQYEPYYYKGHITDFPMTLAYGKKIDDLRRRYKDYLWDGQFRDTIGASVTADGRFRYSVFDAPNGKRAVVVVNTDSKPISAMVNVPNAGSLVTATPDDPDAQPATGAIQIPARCAAVVMEQ